MSKTNTPVVDAPATAHKLAPTITSKAKAKSVAAADGRKRPIVAINEDGKLVVCCRRTAKKNGWDIQEVLYERAKTVKAPVAEAPAAPIKERRAGVDKAIAKAKKAKLVVDAALDDILGK